jgi:error-prone DNA polymerase
MPFGGEWSCVVKNESIPFVHLHTHSWFSFCRGTDSPERLCRSVRERGMKALAITDTNGLYGLIWFMQFAREAGVRPIVGAEAVWGDERAVVLVRDRRGYAGLCRLLSDLHRNSGPTVGSEGPRDCLPFDLGGALAALPAGVVILTPLARLLERLARERGRAFLYGELSPAEPPRSREALKRFLRRHELPPVATGAVHFSDTTGRAVHRLLRAVATNWVLTPSGSDPPGVVPPGCLLEPPDRLAARHPDLPEAVENAARIADDCRFLPELGRPIFPEYKAPGGQESGKYLEQLCLEGVRRRYGAMNGAIRRRLDHELEVIRDKGFAPYFLVVRDVVAQAPRTCGRGSAAASLVSYLLGITNVDPIRHNLYFERFLNPGRTDPPDIDVDFPWDERDGVLEWVFDRFGLARTAMIANHNSFRTRAAVREIAKALGLPDAEIARVCKRFPWHAGDPAETVRSHPRFRGLRLDDPWPRIFEMARAIRGAPRNLSVHCGGVVIVPGRIDEYVPVQPTPKGLPVIQWEKDQAEDAGLVKIDLLGNRSLAVIRDACREVAERGAEKIDFQRFDPTDDEETRELMRRGRTMGVFYVESPATRQLQAKCGRGDFEHLVIHSSIIRPAANAYVQEYIRRLRGGAWAPLHPVLEHVLRETYGLMVYQEDISRTAIAIAGFDAASADDLRKVLSKKHKRAKLAEYRRQLWEGARRRGLEDELIEKIWNQIISFSGYSFCKPHSASYAMVSFQSAYLRAHHPAEFMAAVISNRGGYYSTLAYVSECRRMGLSLLPPSVNRSEKRWTGSGKALRVGLMQLKSCPDEAIDLLLEERRRGGPYRSLENLLRRLDGRLQAEVVKILVLSGACDDLLPAGGSRADLVWQLTAWSRRRERVGRPAGRLFATPTADERKRGGGVERLPRMGAYDEKRFLEHEVETLGLLVSRHPLLLYRDTVIGARALPARELKHYAGRRVTTVGWYVTGKPVLTKRGEPMEFLSFEDTTAIYETTFFPRAYRRFCSMISRTRPYLLTGRVEENYGVVSLNVDALRPLSRTMT